MHGTLAVMGLDLTPAGRGLLILGGATLLIAVTVALSPGRVARNRRRGRRASRLRTWGST